MAKIVCAGLAVCDILIHPVDRNVFDLDSVYPQYVGMSTGGDALNVAVNLSKLGMGEDLLLVANIGDDVFGSFVEDVLRRKHVVTHGLKRLADTPTAMSFILIEDCGERHFICIAGANQMLCVDDILACIGTDTQYLHLSSLMALPRLEAANLRALFEAAKKRGIHTSFDMTSAAAEDWLSAIREGLPWTDTLFMSENEVQNCLKYPISSEDAARVFHDLGAKEVVFKLGEKGCYVSKATRESFFAPAYRGQRIVDTTGAGDAFVSAYLYGKIHNLTSLECAVIGNANGVLAANALGANEGTATLAGMIDFLKGNGTNGLVPVDRLIDKLESFNMY